MSGKKTSQYIFLVVYRAQLKSKVLLLSNEVGSCYYTKSKAILLFAILKKIHPSCRIKLLYKCLDYRTTRSDKARRFFKHETNIEATVKLTYRWLQLQIIEMRMFVTNTRPTLAFSCLFVALVFHIGL